MDARLIIMIKPTVIPMVAGPEAVTFSTDAHPIADRPHELNAVLGARRARLVPLFGVGEPRLRHSRFSFTAATGRVIPDLSLLYQVDAPLEQLEPLAQELRGLAVVDAAFIKPPPERPNRPNGKAALSAPAPLTTPDFTVRQSYLEAAPAGVDARYAWSLAGGGGAGVNIVDVEGAWRLSHEDLIQNVGGLVAGSPPDDAGWRNHGTAVLGVFHGNRNGFGITGICPEARVRTVCVFGMDAPDGTKIDSPAAAIRVAADLLRPGDILLVELHQAGPRNNFAPLQSQAGYIPMEWWPDDFLAIQYATAKGIIVVEAGGNGGENLDDAIYDINPSPPYGPFPSWWKNPFRRNPLDSGAILVGAGAPPVGTHGSDWGPDRSRLDFSNWGNAVDVQGWGREVTSVGYGDLQGGDSEDNWYTDAFAGTSSASPMVVGALGCVQGILVANGVPALTPATARANLRGTGSPQQGAAERPSSQRIGSRPDLRQLVQALVPRAVPAVPMPSASAVAMATPARHEFQAAAGQKMKITIEISA